MAGTVSAFPFVLTLRVLGQAKWDRSGRARLRLGFAIALLAALPAQLAWGQGNSAAARWCAGSFPPSAARGDCVSQAAHGSGPYFDCGPGGNNVGLCAGICCLAGEVCAANVCASPTPTPTPTPTTTPTETQVPTDTPTATPVPLLDFSVPGFTGTVTYAGGGSPLVGAGIGIASVVDSSSGLPVPCVGCRLDFATGALESFTSTTWEFSGGGIVTVTGSVPAAGAAGILLSGSFTHVTVTTVGSFRVMFAGFADTKDPTLLSFFSFPTGSYMGNFNVAFLPVVVVGPPAAFDSSVVLSGDVTNVPGP